MMLGNDYGFYGRYLTHSIQTATRAHRDGDEEYVVCALLHDIGDNLASNHADFAIPRNLLYRKKPLDCKTSRNITRLPFLNT